METTQQTAQAPDAGLAEKFKVILGKLSAANAAPETIKRIASASNTIGALTDFFTEAISELVRMTTIKEEALVEQLRNAEKSIVGQTRAMETLFETNRQQGILIEELRGKLRTPKAGKKGG